MPQGGLISPFLANIVLDLFDKYMYKYINRLNTGKTRKRNPAYNRLMYHLRKAKATNNKTEYKKIRETMMALPSITNMDPNYKRMEYIRYADDFVILVSGSLNDAKLIKANIKEFLSSHCGATLSEEKTIITNLRDNKFEFLGADIRVKKRSTFLFMRKNTRVRIVDRLLINAPMSKLINKLLEAKFIRRNQLGDILPLSQGKLVNLDHYSIINFYNSKINGIVNYYSFASNRSKLQRILYYLQSSCAYTLAEKYKTSAPQIYQKYGKRLMDPITKKGLNIYNTLKVTHKFNITKSLDPPLLKLLDITWSGRITQSNFNKTCKLCDSTYKIEMHHLRKVADIRHKMRTGNSTYDQ